MPSLNSPFKLQKETSQSSDSSAKTEEADTLSPELVELQKQREALTQILEKPWIKSSIQALKQPEVRTAMTQLVTSPQRDLILYTDLVWFILFIVFRMWRISKLSSRQWLRHLWLRIWSLTLFSGVSFVVIPGFFLGKPYLNAIHLLLKQSQAAIFR